MSRLIRVTAINNESMWVDTDCVRMVGPLMDRGLRQLGRAVLYMEGLPPLPCKESVDDLADRVEKGTAHGFYSEGETHSGGADGSADGGAEARLVVEA